MSRMKEIFEAAEKVQRKMRKENVSVKDDEIEVAKPKKTKPIAYYDSESMSYFTENSKGQWIRTKEGHLTRILERVVFRDVTKKEGRDEMIDDYMIAITKNYDVALAIPLAGFPIGLHTISGETILVTKEARYITPRTGDCNTVLKLAQELMGAQAQYMFGWLKAGFRTLRDGHPFRPGQAMTLCGPGGCGKSLWQNLVTEMYGGRCSLPYKFLTGRTDFNSQLFYAEHLMIEDQAAATNIAARRALGAAIKSTLVNETQEYHRKNKEPIVVSPFWRMTITLNNEPENMMVLPPMDDSLVDKITMLLCEKATFPFAADDLKARRTYRETLSKELPAFLAWLNAWKMPDELKDRRYGVVAWQNPELLKAINELSPESKMLELIDAIWIWDADKNPWVGKSSQLEQRMLEKDKLGRVIRLLSYNTACGTYLARLAKLFPERVNLVDRPNNSAVWEITPPAGQRPEPIPD